MYIFFNCHDRVKIAILTWLLGSVTCYAQNLVPNPGFESNTGCPGPSVFLQHTEHWSGIDNHGGTPDLYRSDCPYNRVGETQMAPGQYPREGKCFIGLFTRGDELREYCTVELLEPLVKGQTYLVEYWVRPATGYGTVINSFGLHFSMERVQGPSSRSLNHVPLVEHISNPTERMLSDTAAWTAISGKYTAEGGERYITLGNFRGDADTRGRVIKENCIRPDRSYLLIDQVSVKAEVSTPPNPPVATGTDTLSTTVVSKFVSDSPYLTVHIWDHKEIDGDIINILLNDRIVLRAYTIRRRKKKLKIPLAPGSNTLSLQALNLGSIPPNTAAITLSDSHHKRNFVLNSTLQQSEAIEIVFVQ